jgi:hypothetical protein
MKRLNRNLFRLAVTSLAVLGLAVSAPLAQPKVVTFDDGLEGWDPQPDFTTIMEAGGNPGAMMNFTNYDDETSTIYVRGWFSVVNRTDPAFIGDYTAKGPMRITLDVDVEYYDLWNWGSWLPVEEYREVVIELRDTDNPYTDPETGYSWPWTSVWYVAEALPNRDAGFKSYVIDIPDVDSEALPPGWRGYGGPEDPVYYTPQLPPGRNWTNVLSEIDEIYISSLNLDYFYSLNFSHDINFDNISIKGIPNSCDGIEATVWVDTNGVIRGGELDGTKYVGVLAGTNGDDVLVGTEGRDNIMGSHGDDLVCALGGNDKVNGQWGQDTIFGGPGNDNLVGHGGDDFIDGGEGNDHINGGQGDDECLNGEIVSQCDDDSAPSNGNARHEAPMIK